MYRPFYTHGHLRADAITRTGVVEPYYVRQISPVTVARHTIDPFIWSVRATGWEGMTPWQVKASCDCAKLFAKGEPAQVTAGGETKTVSPGEPPPAGPTGQIVAKAYEILHNMFKQPPGAIAPGAPVAPAVAPVQDKSVEAPAATGAEPATAGTRAVFIPPPS